MNFFSMFVIIIVIEGQLMLNVIIVIEKQLMLNVVVIEGQLIVKCYYYCH